MASGCADGGPVRTDATSTRRSCATATAYGRVGYASWYASGYDDRRTASGANFDMNGMTAAHRTLPFGTRIRVTNLDNGRSAVLTVTDRGPVTRGRLIDVSRRAAEKLDFISAGTAHVRVRALGC